MEARILALARSTETEKLCAAWGLSRAAVMARKKGERPMTFREVGALTRINGVKLSKILLGP